MYSQEEKVLILGSLFHDIGKFVQRCNIGKAVRTHPIEGKLFLGENLGIKESLAKIVGSEDQLRKVFDIILNHHKPKNQLEMIVQSADRLSASEKELLEKSSHCSYNILLSSQTYLTRDNFLT